LKGIKPGPETINHMAERIHKDSRGEENKAARGEENKANHGSWSS